MKDIEQHYLVNIEIDGCGKVSFATDLGWEQKSSVTLDLIGIDDIKKTVKAFIEQRDVAPFENCTSNEHHVDKAHEIIQQFNKMIEDALAGDEVEHDGVLIAAIGEDSICISVELEKSYVVNFGEK